MPEGYHSPPSPDDGKDPRLAIRRHSDRCFFRVEEIVKHGYIVDGIFIDEDEVAEVVNLDEHGAVARTCQRDPEVRHRPNSTEQKRSVSDAGTCNEAS